MSKERRISGKSTFVCLAITSQHYSLSYLVRNFIKFMLSLPLVKRSPQGTTVRNKCDQYVMRSRGIKLNRALLTVSALPVIGLRGFLHSILRQSTHFILLNASFAFSKLFGNWQIFASGKAVLVYT